MVFSGVVNCSPMKIRPGQAEKNKKSEFTYSVRQLTIAETMKRCVPLRRNVAEKPRGMRLKFVLPSYAHVHMKIRTCSFSSRVEQESVESSPVKLNGVSFNLEPRSHSGRGRSGYQIRGRLKRAL